MRCLPGWEGATSTLVSFYKETPGGWTYGHRGKQGSGTSSYSAAEMELTGAGDTWEQRCLPFPTTSQILQCLPFAELIGKELAQKKMKFAGPPASQNWNIIVNKCHHKLLTLNLRARVYQKNLVEEADSAIISVCSLRKRRHFGCPLYIFMHLEEYHNHQSLSQSRNTYKCNKLSYLS